MPHNMVNFRLLAAEICWQVSSTPANFNRFRLLAALQHGTLVLGISQSLQHWTEGSTYIRQAGHQVGHWPTFWFYIVVCKFSIFTGSIARRANLPVFSLLRGRFWGFSPTLHRWGWNLACQISPPSVQRQGCRTPKIEIFTQIWPKSGI